MAGRERPKPAVKMPLTWHFIGAGDENRTRTISLGS
jgi:hypothetical protein